MSDTPEEHTKTTNKPGASELEAAKRPATAAGRPIDLITNYFTVLRSPQFKIYEFDVSFYPEVASVILRKELVKRALHIDGFRSRYVFDGDFFFSQTYHCYQIMEISSNYPTRATYTICFKYMGEVLQEVPPTAFDDDYSLVLELLVADWMAATKLYKLGNAYHYKETSLKPPPSRNVTIWPGYKVSLERHGTNYLLHVDVCHKLLSKDTAKDVIRDCRRRAGVTDSRLSAERELTGNVVMTKAPDTTDKYAKYRINDIDWSVSPWCTIQQKGSSTEISYIDYYREYSRYFIQDREQPLLGARRKKECGDARDDRTIFLLPELSILVADLSTEAKEDHTLMHKLIRAMRLRPQRMTSHLTNFRQRLVDSPGVRSNMDQWDVHLSQDLLRVSGRVIPLQSVVFGAGNAIRPSSKADWSKAVSSARMFAPAECRRWTLICPGEHIPAAAEFVKQLQKACDDIGLSIGKCKELPLSDSSISSYYQAIDESARLGVTLALCVIKEQACFKAGVKGRRETRIWNRALYASIKKRCSTQNALVSQVIQVGNLSAKNVRTIAASVAMQLNAKLGGIPWIVKTTLLRTMVIGIDVQHDSEDRKKLVCGVVASNNATFTKYVSSVCPYSKREPARDLVSCVRKALDTYRRKNNEYPVKVFIYRSGVGAGNIDQLSANEISYIAAAFDEHKIALTYVTVKSRTNTRLMKVDAEGGPNRNAPPGTVVTDLITGAEEVTNIITSSLMFDFFMVPHWERSGTSRATYFRVLHNTKRVKEKHCQNITFKQCHLYANSPATVPIPAPLLYAQRLTRMVAEYIHEKPNERLSELLWFI